jgi:tetratricopeptide (TPR) repeat protein
MRTLERAFDHYRQIGDFDGAIAVAEYELIPPVDQHREVIELIGRALAFVRQQSPSQETSRHEGRLLARLGMAKGMVEGGSYDSAHQDIGQARTIASMIGDTELEMRIQAGAARVARFHLRFDDCLDRSIRVIQLAQELRQDATEEASRRLNLAQVEAHRLNLAQVEAHRLAANVLTYQGKLEAYPGSLQFAGHHVSPMLTLAGQLNDKYWLATAFAANERQARLLGQWGKAREFSEAGLSSSPEDVRLLGPRALMEHELGNEPDRETFLDRYLKSAGLAAPGTTAEQAAPALLISLIWRTKLDLPRALLNFAEGEAEEIIRSPSDTPLVRQTARAGRGLLEALKNDQERDRGVVREQYLALTKSQTVADTILPTGIGVHGNTVLALLARGMGDLDKAIGHFDAALTFCERSGCRPELAWACYHYAETLLDPSYTGNRQAATSLLDRAQGIATGLHMSPLSQRVEELRNP